MTLIVDAGPIVAATDPADPFTDAIERILREEPGELIIPAPVTAEVDYLVGRRHGARVRRAFGRDLAVGRFAVHCLTQHDHRLALDVDERYADLDIGLAGASLVVAAHRHGTTRLLTFDERHFRAVAPLSGGAFTLLPADEEDERG